MKIKRKILNKIFVIILAIILIMCFFPNKTSAHSYKDYAGGSLFEIIFSFLDYIGDIIMNTLQRNFISPQPVLKTASAESQGNWNWFAFFGVVIGIIAMVVGICMTGGALAAIGTAAAGVIIKGVTVGTFVFLTAGTATLVVGNENLVIMPATKVKEITNEKFIVVMKVYKHEEEVINTLEEKGFNYIYASRVGREGEIVSTDREEILQLRDYMSLIIASRE